MEDILSKYNTSIQGLSEGEALKRIWFKQA